MNTIVVRDAILDIAKYFLSDEKEMVDVDPTCFEGFQIVSELEGTNKLYVVESVETKKPAIMKVYTGDLTKFARDVEYTRLLSAYDIAPHLLFASKCNKRAGVMILEKYQMSLRQLIEKGPIEPELKKKIECLITAKVKAMHELGIAHGDLHADNIVLDLHPLRIAIIDYEMAFPIAEGRHDPRVLNWMKDGFDWEEGYDAFVNYDLTNWKIELD